MRQISFLLFLTLGVGVCASAQERRVKVIQKAVNAEALDEHGSGIHGAVFMGDGDPQMMFMGRPDTHFEGGVVENAPYSAESVSEMEQTLADGNRIKHENRTKVYRDGLGRTRRETSLAGVGPWATGEPHSMIFINDPSASVQWAVNPQNKTAIKMEIPKMGLHVERDHTSSVSSSTEHLVNEEGAGYKRMHIIKRGGEGGETPATASESLGQRMIEGVMADGERTTTKIPAGAMGNEREIEISYERWHSPELGVDVLTERSDPRMGKTTYRLTNIQRTEPSPSLFEPPADYTIEDSKARAVTRTLRVK